MNGLIFPTVPAQRMGQLITTFRSAIRIAYDMLVNPSASPADSIPGLLKSGAPYQIRVPIGNATPQLLVPHPAYLASRDQYISFNLGNPRYWDAYMLRVTELLQKPFARRFLSLGGILWRLALQFGPADLIARALAGPSSYATVWQSGDISDGHCDDIATAAEIGILLGRNFSGTVTCWPPYDLWNASIQWKGSWSNDNESWFQSQLSRLSASHPDAPQNRQEWRKKFQLAPSAYHGSDACARRLFGQLGYPIDCDPFWDLAQYKT
ncbi:hypothetical protein BDR07DRAFT_1494636 [Suillus spraguei]|nr:hypothetical protein BDR07DRAFT_1494636 [Suillus spraguei]